MEVGITTTVADWSIDAQTIARMVEEAGIPVLGFGEHTHIPAARETPYPGGSGAEKGKLPPGYERTIDLFVTLTQAAMVTTTLKLATGILQVVQRDPIITAKEVATIDQLSQGRFLFGVGNGWNQDEIENHGTAFKSRHKLARERIEAMKAIWANEEPEYHGEFVKFDKMKQWPKPFQKPHPPIIVGGRLEYAAKRAFRYGDGWIPRDDWLETEGIESIHKFRKMAADAGRDPAGLPISIFRTPDNLDRLKLCQDIGIDRVVFSLPAEKEDKILPIMDRWAELQRQLGG